ncbi:hypothetical protein HELRODRAFT_165911 [Helobdella robusta]|uniref:B3/B4 tRNA-binding domain-containing protein n=1 Tax=Helobdella robusta TaxID=6412 RepID=T1EXF9_HELRO|nr:hypothetical protein HELRODRAFT_165911 [Helobdella robusta]ESN91829.1 hypothetical protein HELRODRAFT_165911 [Helobdella robusta]
MWKEIETAKSENRRELVLTGADVLTRIQEKGGLDELKNVFSLKQLNFLEISCAGLKSFHDKIGELTNLTNLVLRNNKFVYLPSTLGLLSKLKFLDVSNNCLTSLPNELSNLKELHTLNANCNQLTEFINISSLTNLHELNLSHNSLTELPEGVNSRELGSLMTLTANDNKIAMIPDDLSKLPNLKTLDLSNNLLDSLPAEMADCGKLKDFKCTGNNLKDKRLLKLVNQCSTKAILDYLKTQKQKNNPNAKKEDKTKKTNKEKGGKAEQEVEVKNSIKILHVDINGSTLVKIMPQALSVRPHMVCCIVRNLNFSKSNSSMKRFIALQTRLHDETCAKRQLATIATHDLEKIKFPLIYDAREPVSIKIQPLNKLKEVTANVLVMRLRKEAEELRKEKKRNTVSGVHKYLNLLKDQLYPCVLDDSSRVISFPPIVNSNVSKVTKSTRHIFIEVTGSHNLDVCKKVMDQLLINLMKMGIGQEEEVIIEKEVDSMTKDMESHHITSTASGDAKNESEEKESPSSECKIEDEGKDEDFEDDHQQPDDNSPKILIVEQVKVVDNLNNLKVVYPSRVDLQPDHTFKVIRNSE